VLAGTDEDDSMGFKDSDVLGDPGERVRQPGAPVIAVEAAALPEASSAP
jgi:hypothetical protein